MNWETLERKVVEIARENRPGEAVPYAFEQRVLHAIRAGKGLDLLGEWSSALWRGAALCAMVAMLLAGWSWLLDSASSGLDLGQQFETTVLAAVEQDPGLDGSW